MLAKDNADGDGVAYDAIAEPAISRCSILLPCLAKDKPVSHAFVSWDWKELDKERNLVTPRMPGAKYAPASDEFCDESDAD